MHAEMNLSARVAQTAPPEMIRIRELEDENRRLLTLVGELLMTNQQLREQYSKNGCGQPVAAR